MKRYPFICCVFILVFLFANNLTVYASTNELSQPLEKQEVVNICKALLDGYSTFVLVKGNYERLAAEVWYKHLFSPVEGLLNHLFPEYARKFEYRFVKDN
jgi:hypothetical protein